jgi:uncharacterized protein YbjT (DUF2867 family)
MSNKILVIGATGNVGHPLVNLLKNKGERIKAATRNPTKYPTTPGVEAIAFDFDKPETYRPALEGANRVVLMPRGLDTKPETTTIPLIDQAIKMGIRHIVLISGIGTEKMEGKGYGLLETYLMTSGIDYTILCASWFMSLFIRGFINPQQKDRIALPVGDTQISFIDPYDVAAVTATTLIEAGYQRKLYNLTGSQALTLHECAEILSKVVGYNIQYIPITDHEMRDEYRMMGKMSKEQIEYMMWFFKGIREGWYTEISPSVSEIIGREPITFKQFVERNADAWKT